MRACPRRHSSLPNFAPRTLRNVGPVKHLSLLLALVLSLSVGSSLARACSCLVQDAPSSLAAATWVFEGELLRTTLVGDPNQERSMGVFRVSHVWKGTVAQEVTVQIPSENSMCPPHFQVGERYVVYAVGPATAPRVARCARYAHPRTVPEERRALGTPTRTY